MKLLFTVPVVEKECATGDSLQPTFPADMAARIASVNSLSKTGFMTISYAPI